MNILFIAQFKIEPNKGGVGRVTDTLAKEFIKRGLGVSYLSLTNGKTELTEGIKQYYIPNSKQLISPQNIVYIRNLILQNNIHIVINQAGIYKEPLNLIHKALPDNVKLYSVHHNCIACLRKNYRNILMGNASRSKILRHFDYPPVWKLLKYINKVKYGHYFKETIIKSDKLVLLSPFFIQELYSYIKQFPRDKVIAIPNPNPFPIKEGIEYKKENRLLYVGRIEYSQKRTDLLLDIWKKLYLQFPNWQMDVVGDGSIRQELEKRTKKIGLERITFYGFKDPRPFLEKAKFFIMTSAFEGYGMVLVEAQAYGVVPFAFKCFSALPDIIAHGKTGMIIQPFQIDQYVEMLSMLMKNEDERKRMAKNAQNSVKKYAPKKIVNTWIRLFENLL